MTKEQSRGRLMLVTIIALSIAIELLTWAAELYVGRFRLTSVTRLGLEVTMFYFVWQGVRWVRWAVVALYSTGGIGGALLALLSGNQLALLVLGSISVVFTGSAAALGLSRDVGSFLAYQREGAVP